MKITQLKIDNPITKESVDKLFEEIKGAKHGHLIIDVGAHDFESLKTMKYFKHKFLQKRDLIENFSKLAFIHPPQFSNISDQPDTYNYFTSKDDAIVWLNT